MSFLTPLFLLGLAALAIPVLIHLTQRERKTVVEFPSLMFLRKIPVRVGAAPAHSQLGCCWRCALAALALIVAAFARPFLRGSELAASGGGAREVVVLLDRSYSMGYGDSGRAPSRRRAHAVGTRPAADRASLVLFSPPAEARAAVERRRVARRRGDRRGAAVRRRHPLRARR